MLLDFDIKTIHFSPTTKIKTEVDNKGKKTKQKKIYQIVNVVVVNRAQSECQVERKIGKIPGPCPCIKNSVEYEG